MSQHCRLILNRADASVTTRLDFSDFPFGSGKEEYRVRDVQLRQDMSAACQHVSITIASHATAFLRLTKIADSCQAAPTPPCTAPPPPAPPSPGPCYQGKQCRSCGDASKPCPFPLPPLPPCPAGFTEHASGYWANPDQKASGGHAKSVADCGVYCAGKGGCKGFEVYDPNDVTEPSSVGGSACYTYSNGLAAFTPDQRGLIRTCVSNNE
jgi:hypothetical protein